MTEEEVRVLLKDAFSKRILLAGSTVGEDSLKAAIDAVIESLREGSAEGQPVGAIILKSGGGKASESIKPSHVLRKRLDLLMITSAAFKAVDEHLSAPWSVTFAIIALAARGRSLISQAICEADAAVLWAMVLATADGEKASDFEETDLYNLVGKELRFRKRSEMSLGEFEDSLKRLEEIGSIARKAADRSRWYITDTVHIEWTE